VQHGFIAAFALVCTFHAFLLASAMRLPLSVEGTTEYSLATFVE
jgi:hypothetical protein